MLFQDLKDVRGKAHPLVMLAEAERSQGDFARSHKHFRETLVLEKELGLHDSLAFFALAGVMLLSACVETPMGSTVQVMPGPNTSLASFQNDQATCRQFAQQAVADQAQGANLLGLGTAGLTTALGAGLGGAIGGGDRTNALKAPLLYQGSLQFTSLPTHVQHAFSELLRHSSEALPLARSRVFKPMMKFARKCCDAVFGVRKSRNL